MSDLSEVLQVTSRQTVLVVGCDQSMTGMLTRRLGDLEIVQVEDASLLEKYIIRYRPSAMVVNILASDIQPAKLNGNNSIPVIQVSLPSQAWLAQKYGITKSIIKPVTSDQLSECMERYDHVQDILIVDDDREFVQLLYRYLQTSGKKYNVRFAYDGDEGWESLNQQPPDLVMLDLVLPGRDGLGIIEAMKRNPSLSNTEVLVITGTQFDEEMKDKFESQIYIQQKGGLSYNQIVACIKAIVSASIAGDRPVEPMSQ